MVWACAPTNISKVEDELGPPRDVVQKGDLTVYYYYKNLGEGVHSYGWKCQEFTFDKDGKIVKKREYWLGNDLGYQDFRKSLQQGISSQ